MSDSAVPENQDEVRMTFWEHVEELRRRLLIGLLALAAATAFSFIFTEWVIQIFAEPIGSLDALQSIEVTENIAVFMRVALLCGSIIAMPIILYELLAFIIPGLKKDEKRWIYFAIFFGTILFMAGAAFAYFIMLPASIQFLIEFLSVETKPRLSSYINFITSLIFWMGVSFQFPLIVFALVKMRVVSLKSLAGGWRYAVVVITILSAIITPTVDPVNMALLMIPLILLYFISLLLAALAAPGKK